MFSAKQVIKEEVNGDEASKADNRRGQWRGDRQGQQPPRSIQMRLPRPTTIDVDGENAAKANNQ